MTFPLTIVGLGEAVFDVFPDKEVLGGTSLNVAVQAHQLLDPLGGRGVLLSRIGADDLGQRLQAEFQSRGCRWSMCRWMTQSRPGRCW